MIRASRARATNRRRKRILRLQKSYPSFGASVKISVSKKEPQRCFVEVLDESASPLTTGVLRDGPLRDAGRFFFGERARDLRSEEHTSVLQSLTNLVCRLLLEKKKKKKTKLKKNNKKTNKRYNNKKKVNTKTNTKEERLRNIDSIVNYPNAQT